MRQRSLVLGLMLALLAGCKTLPPKPYPPDPLFTSREPEAGKAPTRPHLLAAATPMPRAPAFPVNRLTRLPDQELDGSEPPAQAVLVGREKPEQPARFQYAEDYRWLIGVLDRHYEGQCHLRYCPPTEPDRWGGKVRLEDQRLAGFRDGDVVRVEGILAPLLDPPAPGECPRYYIKSIRLLTP